MKTFQHERRKEPRPPGSLVWAPIVRRIMAKYRRLEAQSPAAALLFRQEVERAVADILHKKKTPLN